MHAIIPPLALLLVAGALSLATGCSGSHRGAWSTHDQKEARDLCESSLEKLRSTRQPQLLDADAFCTCFTKQLESRFESMRQASESRNPAVGDSITQVCLQEAQGSDQATP
ncbi:MAG: hypothetical protein KF690_09350 [Bacteroidetes bacterium]|nr:hypothetical protein [Bacteroidota bacterium]